MCYIYTKNNEDSLTHFYGQLHKTGQPTGCKSAYVWNYTKSAFFFDLHRNLCLWPTWELSCRPVSSYCVYVVKEFLKGRARNIYKILLNEKWCRGINILRFYSWIYSAQGRLWGYKIKSLLTS